MGHLKIFLGYASGVGKSFRMLDEARRRKERGQDVIVGAVQAKVPEDVAELLKKLEVVPLRNGSVDVDRIITRRPVVCFIDGLAYGTRWREVQRLLDAGIKVVGSINIQYVAELADDISKITGKRVTDTVPLAFLESASEIEIVDAPPESDHAPQLSKLRELALVLAADVVDRQLTHYYGTQERILVCITPRANAHTMIDAAKRIADRFHGELIVAYMHQPGLSDQDRIALEEKLAEARAAGAQVEILEGDDFVDAVVEFAKEHGITQIFMGHSLRSGWRSRIFGTPVDALIRQAEGVDIRVFPQ